MQYLKQNHVQAQYTKNAGQRNIVLKARQMGISTWVAASFFLDTIARPGTMSVLVAHDMRAAASLFQIVDRFWRNLDDDLREGPLKRRFANVKQMVFGEIDSEFRIETASDPDAGRGLTIQNLHCSELSRWPVERGLDAAATLAALRAAVVPQGRIVLESTPSGNYGCFYEEWHQAKESGYEPHFFPWWFEPAYRKKTRIKESSLTEEERELQKTHSLDLEQIAFRRSLTREYRGLAKQEFAEDAETCFLAGGDCYFEIKTVNDHLQFVTGLPATVKAGVHSFLPAKPKREYIIAADVAEGGSNGDYSCAQVIDAESALQCAEFHGRCTPRDFAAKLQQLAEEYNHAIVVVERNGPGGTVLDRLKDTYEFLYMDESGKLGWLTGTHNRQAALSRLSNAFSDHPDLFSSVGLLTEMRSFVNQRNGSPCAASGSYDDRVMAMAIALAVQGQGMTKKLLKERKRRLRG